MTERTYNIIRACKGAIYPEIESKIDRIRTYMSNECNCPIEEYTAAVTENIIVDAMYDYIDSCDKPSLFLRQMRDCVIKDLTLTERICVAFSLAQVRDKNGRHVNGFKEEWI